MEEPSARTRLRLPQQRWASAATGEIPVCGGAGWGWGSLGSLHALVSSVLTARISQPWGNASKGIHPAAQCTGKGTAGLQPPRLSPAPQQETLTRADSCGGGQSRRTALRGSGEGECVGTGRRAHQGSSPGPVPSASWGAGGSPPPRVRRYLAQFFF